MDSIVRDFWWGHNQGERNMHFLNWVRFISQNKNGGLGFKRFSLMNQAMLAKQYRKLIQNPNSLLAITLKSKFYPNCSLQETTTKPHHPGNVSLKDGKWLIGRGQNISLTKQYWFKSNSDSLSRFGLQNGTVADLFDQSSYSWNFDLIRAIYSHAQWSDIMAIPISKTASVSDELVWKYSADGECKVRTAYSLVLHVLEPGV